ncbi:MAG: peroxide stress protein YaaA [Holdemanella sp.]|nr:peroxide stress protein YaaA [Holdemanella sp.]
MRIILSPAKKMKLDDSLDFKDYPIYLDNTKEIRMYLKTLDFDSLKKLWKCNDTLVNQNMHRLEHMNLDSNLGCAILCYEGIAFQHMAPNVFSNDEFDYIQSHLRILSAFYGILKPMDGITPYRLEMQANASINGFKDLYAYWGSKLYEQVIDDSHIIINLASKEYSKCIEPYLKKEDRFITIHFVEMNKGKLVTKGTYAKMARGEMVRYMASHHIEDVEEIKVFHHLGYHYREDISSQTEFVFERSL